MLDQPRRRDPAATRQGILDAAFDAFTADGLDGTRVDAIAGRTQTTVRMIYYYFGSKDGLYRAVLERAYTTLRTTEAGLGLDRLPPEAAIRRLVEFTFDYHEANPGLSRLVTIENINQGVHLAQLDAIRALNHGVIDTIDAILARGRAAGLFRADATAGGTHLLMTSFCFFRVANRHTLATVIGQSPLDPAFRLPHRAMIVDAVLGYLRAPVTGLGPGAPLSPP